MPSVSIVPFTQTNYRIKNPILILSDDVDRIPYLKKIISEMNVDLATISTIKINMAKMTGMTIEMVRMLTSLLHNKFEIDKYTLKQIDDFMKVLNFLEMFGQEEFDRLISMVTKHYPIEEIMQLESMKHIEIFASMIFDYDFVKDYNRIKNAVIKYRKSRLDSFNSSELLKMWIFYQCNGKTYDVWVESMKFLFTLDSYLVLQTLQAFTVNYCKCNAHEKVYQFIEDNHDIIEKIKIADICKLIHNKLLVENAFKNLLLLCGIIINDMNMIRLIIEKTNPICESHVVHKIIASQKLTLNVCNYLIEHNYLIFEDKILHCLLSGEDVLIKESLTYITDLTLEANESLLSSAIQYYLKINNSSGAVIIANHYAKHKNSNDIKYSLFINSIYYSNSQTSYDICMAFEDEYTIEMMEDITWFEWLYHCAYAYADYAMIKRFKELRYSPSNPHYNIYND
jgi:hypothetical protein